MTTHATSVPPCSARLLGPQLPTAVRFAELLAGDGVEHGHIGPREVPRLWQRHILNCALVTELLPPDVSVVDIGSGAGLPGIPMAIRRPDLRVLLVEPMSRRVRFLARAVGELGLEDRVTVLHGRADAVSAGASPWIVARAVAPLNRLVEWCLPLLTPNGSLLALKGRSAEDEVARWSAELAGLGAATDPVRELVDDDVDPTWVVTVRRRSRDRGIEGEANDAS